MNIINLRTEYSFKQVYGHLDQVVTLMADRGATMLCISDFNNTFGHIPFNNVCKEHDIKPVFGVSVGVVEKPEEKIRQTPNFMPLVAMNNDGLKEIYEFIGIAYQHFYHVPRVGYEHINRLSENVTVLSGPWCNFNRIERHIYMQLSPDAPKSYATDPIHPVIAAQNNYYPIPEDKSIWQIFAGPQRYETTHQHILTKDEWGSMWSFPYDEMALKESNSILEQADVTLKVAPMVKYTLPKKGFGHIRQKQTSSESDSKALSQDISLPDIKTRTPLKILDALCFAGAKKLNLDISVEPYYSRLIHELDVISEKDFADYFLIVSDMVNYAKEHMLVGAGRGSSSGSLVCYLIGITEIDPIPFGLMFERFIDINRTGLPDIDVDFPDKDRQKVIDYLMDKYGKDNVAKIGTITTMRPRSAIGEFAKMLDIPPWETNSMKDAIVERDEGDARYNQCIEETFQTEVGKNFLKQFPEMALTEKIEGHARNSGTHAAGIVVSVHPISEYAGMDLRENIAMLDKRNAEDDAGLLKIDVLGLRTLSVLQEVCDKINKPYSWLYTLSLDDKETFQTLNANRFNGVFQFEGAALQTLAKQVGVEEFNDIVVLSSLARPGPLRSGGAELYANRKKGKAEIAYLHDHPKIKEITEDTLGVIVYQEQVMRIVREVGGLSWEDTSKVRKAMGKSLGAEALNIFWIKFLKGCLDQEMSATDAKGIWDNINTFGAYGFNMSHSVSYGLISYLTAYLKTHYPLEFTVSVLNHPGSGDAAERNCMNLLREFVELGYGFEPINKEESTDQWEIKSDRKSIIGPLTNVKGVGQKMCSDIMERRSSMNDLTNRQINLLNDGEVKFSELWPTKKRFGSYYEDPQRFNIMNNDVSYIDDIQAVGQYVFIGKLIELNVVDHNEYGRVQKRGYKMRGQTLFLNMVLEDDTGAISCSIDRKRYDSYGKDIAQHAKTGEDWFLIMGSIKDGWRRIAVQNIRRLDD